LSRLRIAVAVGLVTGLAACSAPPAPAPVPSPSDPAGSAAPASVSTTPSPAAAGCPDGSYAVSAIEGRGSASALGKGSGGNVTMSFVGGSFTLASDGSNPIKLQVGPGSTDLRFAGQIAGTYSGDPAALAMTVTAASGTASVKGFGFSREVPMQQVADQLAPEGSTGAASCDGDHARLELPAVVLDLTRV
jgi:hypothetical protein